MQDGNELGEAPGGGGQGEGRSRPQQGGEAATTRFGMEEGDNEDIAATGGVTQEDEASETSN